MSLLVVNAEFAIGERAIAVVEDGLEVFEAGEVGALPEDADGDFVAPHVTLIERFVEIRRIMALFFEILMRGLNH